LKESEDKENTVPNKICESLNATNRMSIGGSGMTGVKTNKRKSSKLKANDVNRSILGLHNTSIEGRHSLLINPPKNISPSSKIKELKKLKRRMNNLHNNQ
jgi:hypothetical protein